MTRRIVVVVPVAHDATGGNKGVGHQGSRIIASFAIANPDGRLVVERAGAPAKVAQAAEDDALVVGFAAVCARAHRRVPDGLRVRVSSRASGERAFEVRLASTLAGVAASNALLVLGMNDEELAGIAAQIAGTDPGRAVTILAGCTISVHLDCDDTPAVSPVHSEADDADPTFITALPDGTT